MKSKTRKLIWSVPLVAVFAVVGALALFVALTPNSALAQVEEVPGMPMNATAQALGPSSIELLWEAPTTGGSPDGYRIDYSADGDVWYSLEPNHNSTVYTDDNSLMAVQTRHYRIFAFNSGGSSAVLDGITVTTDKSDKADAPTGLTVAAGDGEGTPANTTTQITLTWTAPEDPDGAPVKMYKIEVSKNGRSFSAMGEKTAKDVGCADGNSCMYTHEKLLEMQTRWYRVTATNYPNGMDASAVESSASTTESAMTVAGAIPAVPQNLRAGLNPAGRMWLYWDEPNTDTDTSPPGTPLPGAPIVGYYIYGGSATISTGQDTASLHFVEASTGLALTDTILKKFGTPDFDGPDDTDDAGGGDDENWMFNVMAVNSVVLRNLKNGTWDADDGNFVATALTVNNRKAAVENPNIETNDLLNLPTLKAKRINNVNAGRTNVMLEWKVEKVQSTTSYRLERSEDRIDWEEIALTTATEDNFTDEGRTAGTTYYYRVFASHNKDDVDDEVRTEASRPQSVTTAPAGKPDAPTFDSADPDSETQINLAWTPPGAIGSVEVGHGKVTGYEIDVSEDGKTWTLLATVAGKLDEVYSYDEKTKKLSSTKQSAPDLDVEFHHKGLVQGQTKYYRVSTTNNAHGKANQSVPSDVRSSATLTSLASDSPGGLVVKAKGQTAIELVWNARADDITAAPITGYKIESSPLTATDCAEDWTVLMANTMSTTTSYTHSGLAPETGRCYRVFGINVVSTSSAFVGYGDQYVVTNDDDAIATTDAAMVPGMPMNVSAKADSDQQITVSWDAPASNGGADITGYMVQSKYMMADGTMSDWMDVEPAHTGMERMYMDTGLTPETRYYYQVAATNDIGTGKYSDDMAMAMTTKPNQAPMAVGELDAVTLTVGDDPAMVDVSGAFSDADMDALTYTATSSMTDYATVAVSGSMVTITGVAVGEATIMVTATDPAGAMATQTIMVTVEAANMAPMPEGEIADVMLTVDQMSSTMDVSAYFTDADMDDTLTYTAMSSMEMYATVEIGGDDMNMLTITGVAVGMATITVTATDMAGAMATQAIMVTVEAATSMELTAPTDVVVSVLQNTISVTWTPGSAQNAEQIKVALFNEGVTALSDAVDLPVVAMPPAADVGSHTYSNVPPGTYKVTVASWRAGEGHKLSPLQTVTVEVQ